MKFIDKFETKYVDVYRILIVLVVFLTLSAAILASLYWFGVVASSSVRIGGDSFDSSIVDYIRKRHNLVIGLRAAEEIKINIGAAIETNQEESIGIRGKDQLSGIPRTISISSNEIANAIEPQLTEIALTIVSVLDKTPPELAADVIDRGIMVTGGGALLNNIEKLLAEETGLPVLIADNPLTCVARGGGKVIEIFDQKGTDIFDLN